MIREELPACLAEGSQVWIGRVDGAGIFLGAEVEELFINLGAHMDSVKTGILGHEQVEPHV